MRPCPSDWVLEMHLLGELDAAYADDADHIAGCARCQATLAAKRAAGDAYLVSPAAQKLAAALDDGGPRLAPVAVPTPRRLALLPDDDTGRGRRSARAWRLVGLGATLAAAAAAIVLVWRLPHPARDGRAEAEVLRVEREWSAAYLHDDADALDRVLASEYTLTSGKGEVSNKADDLASMRSHQTRFTAYDNYDVQVRVYGDSAVVTGRSKLRGTHGGQPFAKEIRFTDTLARIDGRWRAVAAHVTTVDGG